MVVRTKKGGLYLEVKGFTPYPHANYASEGILSPQYHDHHGSTILIVLLYYGEQHTVDYY